VLNIDLGAILRTTVSGGYGDLVTRHTGRAVRGGIEEMLHRQDDSQVAVIDFGAVRCLDISCADEIVGRLLRDHGEGHHFVLRGVTDAHCEAISLVLERHGMAVVAQSRDGSLEVLGPLDETARRAFGAVLQSEAVCEADGANRLAVSAKAARPLLDELTAQRPTTQETVRQQAVSA